MEPGADLARVAGSGYWIWIFTAALFSRSPRPVLSGGLRSALPFRGSVFIGGLLLASRRMHEAIDPVRVAISWVNPSGSQLPAPFSGRGRVAV